MTSEQWYDLFSRSDESFKRWLRICARSKGATVAQHIITRRASAKNDAKEVVEYTIDGKTHAKYINNAGKTKGGFMTFLKEARQVVAELGGTVVVRDKR